MTFHETHGTTLERQSDVIFPVEYSLISVHLPSDVWGDLEKRVVPSNIRPITVPPDCIYHSIFANPMIEQPTRYRTRGLFELIETLKREQIMRLGFETLEVLTNKDPKIIPSIKIDTKTRLWNNTSPFMPEDVTAEFNKIEGGLIKVNLVGVTLNYERTIMSFKFSKIVV